MDLEYLNIYDKDGNLLPKKGIRGQKADGFVGIVIIFIENSKGEFLIQKTSSKRGSVYATTGGHVDFGDTFDSSIVKEVKEELGIDIQNDNFTEEYTYVWKKYILKVYYLKRDINIKDIVIQKAEVDFVKWLTRDEIAKLIETNQFREGNIEGYNYIANKYRD